MRGATCGVWPCRRGLVAVIVDEDRARAPLFVTRKPEACSAMLEAFDDTEGLDWELVVPFWLARSDELAHLALARGVAVWLVPDALIEGIRAVAALGTGPPARTAAALARLPRAAVLRALLRRLTPADQRQLDLL